MQEWKVPEWVGLTPMVVLVVSVVPTLLAVGGSQFADEVDEGQGRGEAILRTRSRSATPVFSAETQDFEVTLRKSSKT